MFSSESSSFGFVEETNLPFDTYEKLFVPVFESKQFTEWLKPDHAWQLRLIGAPGCGKTTLSALTVRRLKEWFSGQNVRIASVFFQDQCESDQEQLLQAMLHSIRKQMGWEEEQSASKRVSVHSPDNDVVEDGENLHPLRIGIQQTIASLDQAFLVVDDIDVLPLPLLGSIEQELAGMQCPKLSIMVTSRTPHQYDPDEVTCDFHDSPEPVYWCCKRCYGEGDDFNAEEAEVFCLLCREIGKVCNTCNKSDMLHEPYLYVRYLMYTLDGFADFVTHDFERIHGDLGLGSDCEDKPPSSLLGMAMNRTKPLFAQRVRDRIVKDSDCNVTLAKVRLDSHLQMRETEDVERRGDRFPDNMLAIFDAAIEHVNRLAPVDRRLGLGAIVATVLKKPEALIEFCELEDWLLEKDLLDSSTFPEDHMNLIRVLRSAGGLLAVDYGNQAEIRPYSSLFSAYVKENYNETLFGFRSLVDGATNQ